MEKILIKGGKKLGGKVSISSAKNAILPIIAASILCGDKCEIKNAPMLKDVFVISNVLKDINASIDIDLKNNIIYIDTKKLLDKEPESDLVRKMRASFLIMGPMIARFGKFRLSLPGGCSIGTRPIDLHLKGFAALGAEVKFGHGYVEAYANELCGNKIYLDFPSVGATENIMMTAVLAKGETIIGNAAAEPEIQDLGNFLNAMGAKVTGAGTDTIKIQGVKELKGTTYTPIPDRIEAGTFMVAAAITRSNINIKHVNIGHLEPIIAKLNEMGIDIEKHEDSILVKGDTSLKPVDIKTMPYPGFPTDMQAQMMSLLCTVSGTSMITETIFENRFMHVQDLKRMGANIKIDGRCAVVEGIESFTGCDVKATDLRAGAALILAGLVAEGETKVSDIYHIDRGYVNIEKKLFDLGADIKRIQD